MGAQSSSYSLLSASSVEQSWDHWEVSEPAAAQHDDDDDDEEMPHLQRREAIDDSQLPYKCGLLFFYHIPSTGGVSYFILRLLLIIFFTLFHD